MKIEIQKAAALEKILQENFYSFLEKKKPALEKFSGFLPEDLTPREWHRFSCHFRKIKENPAELKTTVRRVIAYQAFTLGEPVSIKISGFLYQIEGPKAREPRERFVRRVLVEINKITKT